MPLCKMGRIIDLKIDIFEYDTNITKLFYEFFDALTGLHIVEIRRPFKVLMIISLM